MSAVRAALGKARIGMVPSGASTPAQLLRARTFSSAPDGMHKRRSANASYA